MIETRSSPVLIGLAAAISWGVAGQPQAAAQRPAYPIVQEIHVDQDCRILLAPVDQTAAKKKVRFEKDSVICHLESVLSSEHMEEAIVGDELRRSRVAVDEQEFVLQNIAANPVVFVVEQPVGKGWQVDSDPQPVQVVSAKLGAVALFRVNAEPGQIVRLHVGERHATPLRAKVLKTSALTNSPGN